MSTSTGEILKKLSDKITGIYDLELAGELTEIFEVLVKRIKRVPRSYWDLVKKLAVIEKERDEERRARQRAEYDVEYLSKELDEERAEYDVIRLEMTLEEERNQ